MSESVLLIDAGNTRLKWAVKAGRTLQRHGTHAYTDADDYGIPAALDQAFDCVPCEAFTGSVASDRIDKVVADWLHARKTRATTARVSSSPQLRLAYSEPQSLGVDRWLAMLGAQTLYPEALCVADCGTALTLDAVDDTGSHLGGMIVPGFELMQRALLTQTARIHAADQPLPDSLFGASTGAAVNAGATYSLAATLDRFVAETARELGCDPVVMVTGGGRERLLRYAHCDVMEVPDLVLLGLASLTQ